MQTFITTLIVAGMVLPVDASNNALSNSGPDHGNDVACQTDSSFPTTAKPGECYVQVRRPATYRTETERYLVKEKSIRYEIVPAVFKTVEKKVMVRPETKRFEVIPAKFEKKTVDVTMQPEYKRLSATAAEFKPSKERVVVQAESATWKKGSGVSDAVAGVVSEVWCLVRTAAEYKDYTRQNIAKRARLNSHDVDARMEHIPTQVMVKPASVKEIVEPAEYKTVKVRELVTAATSKEIVEPAEFKTVERQVLVEGEKTVWQRVLCDTNLTPDVIKRIQKALKHKHHDGGKANGKLTSQTLQAIKKYQQNFKLSTGGITYEFLEHLKIEL